MTTVDPYVIRIPEKASDNNGRMTDEMRSWFEYDNRWKHDLWQLVTGGTGGDETGGTQESVADDNQIALLTALVHRLNERIQELEGEVQPVVGNPSDFNAVTMVTNYAANDFDFVNAKSKAIISLTSSPTANSVIIVRNGDNSLIKIDGNGKKINGFDDAKIRREGTTLVLHYFIDSDEWLVR